MIAKIDCVNKIPTIFINGTPIEEMAYITYRTQFNKYADFANAGVRLFSVNLNFSEMPINERAPVLAFQKGIFEEDEPDFSIVDKNLGEIFDVCPDAYVFPRVNVNLPRKWEEAHPEELCEKGFGDRTRFSYASDLWAEQVKSYLTELIDYVENSKYGDRIIGYQIAGGNTEEWLSIDPQSGFGTRAKEKFDIYCGEKHLSKTEESYYSFMSETVAGRIVEFATHVKELTGHNKLVGCFYGYTLFVPRSECHNDLKQLLNSNSIDFICSPLTYADVRAPGIDLYPMIPTASLRHHQKVYFSENDIRTHLSRAIHSHPNYTSPIWYGHEKAIAAEQLKLTFCRAMLYGYGMWWFDMWGGWYDDPAYMSLFSRMQDICKDGMDTPDVDVAAFVDEKSVCAVPTADALIKSAVRSLGLVGTPYDAYLMSDFDEVFANYKACIFIEPTETKLSLSCADKAMTASMPVFTIRGEAPAAAELREWLELQDVDVPASCNAVVYRGEKYISVYTGEDGEYDFCDRGERSFTDIFDGTNVTFPTTLPKGKFFLFKRSAAI